MNQSPKQALKSVKFCYQIKQNLVPVTMKKQHISQTIQFFENI